MESRASSPAHSLMRVPSHVLFSVAIICAGIGLPAKLADSKKKPNVLLVVIDTLRADTLGRGITPNIDALAKGGVQFDEAFSHAPMTLPAHAALFSSRLPGEARVITNGQEVARSLPLLGQHLSMRGYDSLAAVSLATLWPVVTGCGVDRGFQLYDLGDRPVERSHEVLPRVTRLLDKRDKSKAFFLFAHFSDPHEPYNCHGSSGHAARVFIDGKPAGSTTTSEMSWWYRNLDLSPGEHSIRFASDHAFKARELRVTSNGEPLTLKFTEGGLLKANEDIAFTFDAPGGEVDISIWLNDTPDHEEIQRRYDLEVSAADRAVGALVKDLKRRGLDRNTLIVLTGDHGEALGERGQFGHVNTLYDEVLRVPLVIRPLNTKDRRTLKANEEELVAHIDLAPTILELIDVAPWSDMRGASLLSNQKRPPLLAETHTPEAPKDLLCLRDHQTKLIFEPETNSFTCYDLLRDPLEVRDIYPERAGTMDDWERKLRAQAALSAGTNIRRDAGGHLAALGYAGN